MQRSNPLLKLKLQLSDSVSILWCVLPPYTGWLVRPVVSGGWWVCRRPYFPGVWQYNSCGHQRTGWSRGWNLGSGPYPNQGFIPLTDVTRCIMSSFDNTKILLLPPHSFMHFNCFLVYAFTHNKSTLIHRLFLKPGQVMVCCAQEMSLQGNMHFLYALLRMTTNRELTQL